MGKLMKVRVSLAPDEDRSYEIWCERGLHRHLRDIIEDFSGGRRILCLWDKRMHKAWSDKCGIPFENLVWDASEERKNLTTVAELARELVRQEIDRHSLLVAIGGGVTGDVVGFLASIYMRGIPVIQIPTTLLAQVDSSVGGKTGVDLPEGKNLVGTFHQPVWVGIDPEFLSTLPEDIFRQGMAEVIKTAWIGGISFVHFLLERNEEICRRDPDVMTEVIGRCVSIKAQIVMEDEKESGLRRILNFGHTFGHALERVSGYKLPHGDAVAMGCRCAAILATMLGCMEPEDQKLLESIITLYGLPMVIPSEYQTFDIIDAFYADKKRSQDDLIFILPERPGEISCRVVNDLTILHKVVEQAKCT